MSEAGGKNKKRNRDSATCPYCHAKLEPDAEKCTQCGHWVEQDDESISDFINEGGPDLPGE